MDVGLVGELMKLMGRTVDEDVMLGNTEKQQKCKERHADFARRCRALRSCCPDKIV